MGVYSEVVPSDQKAIKDWCEANTRRLASTMGGVVALGSDDVDLYRMYNGDQSGDGYEYLTGSKDNMLPAKIRSFPIVRAFFDLLLSTEQSRPMNLDDITAIDKDSMLSRRMSTARRIADMVADSIMDEQQRVSIMRDQIRDQMQAVSSMMQQYAQQGQQGQQVQQGQQAIDPSAMQAAMMQARMSMAELDRVQRSLDRGDIDISARQMEAERKRALSDATLEEISFRAAVKELSDTKDYRDMFDKGFTDLIIVDNEVYFFEDPVEGMDPIVRKVPPMNIRYIPNQDSSMLDDCRAIVETRYMSVSDVLDKYGDELDEQTRLSVSERSGNFGGVGPSYSFPSSGEGTRAGVEWDCNWTTKSPDFIPWDVVKVEICHWVASREVVFEEDGGGSFKIASDTESPGLPGDTMKRHRRYVKEWWRGVRIGGEFGNVVVGLGKVPFQFRDGSGSDRPLSPYCGFAYNGVTSMPYSRAKAVKDLDWLYNLVHWQMELVIALGSLRGIIVDKTQKPRDVPMEEWLMMAKKGMLVIDPTQMADSGRRSPYNQWQTYDLGFGQAIEQCKSLLMYIEQSIGRVLGIPPQRMGEVTSRDQVGTHRQAIIQSNITTETLFNKHYQIRGKVMNKLLAMLPYCWNTGKRGEWVDSVTGVHTFSFKRGDLELRRFRVRMNDDQSERETFDKMSQAVSIAFQSQAIGIGELAQSFRIKSSRELQETIAMWGERAQRLSEDRARGAQQAETEAAKMENEMKLALKQAVDGNTQVLAQLKKYEIDVDAGIRTESEKVKQMLSSQDLALRSHEIDGNLQVDFMELELQAKKIGIDAASSAD